MCAQAAVDLEVRRLRLLAFSTSFGKLLFKEDKFSLEETDASGLQSKRLGTCCSPPQWA